MANDKVLESLAGSNTGNGLNKQVNSNSRYSPDAVDYAEYTEGRGGTDVGSVHDYLAYDPATYFYRKAMDNDYLNLRDDFWSEAARRDESNMLMSLLDSSQKEEFDDSYINSVNKYGDRVDYDAYMLAMSIPHMDDTEMILRTDPESGYEYGEFTDKQWGEYVLDYTMGRWDAEIIEEAKENRVWVANVASQMFGASLSTAGGLLDFVGDINNAIEGAVMYLSSGLDGAKFLEAFGNDEDATGVASNIANILPRVASWVNDASFELQRNFSTTVNAVHAFDNGYRVGEGSNFITRIDRATNAGVGYSTWGRWMNGASNAIGYMLPTIALAVATGGASTTISSTSSTAARTAAITANIANKGRAAIFYTGIFSGMVKENVMRSKVNGISYEDMDALSIVGNAAIKAVAQYAVERALGAVLGFSQIDKMIGTAGRRSLTKGAVGGAATAAVGSTSRSVGRVLIQGARSAAKEGLEEVLQELSDGLIDFAFGSEYRESFLEDFSIQTLVDSFITGAITSIVMGGFSGLMSDVRNPTAAMTKEGAIVRLSPFRAMNYNAAIAELASLSEKANNSTLDPIARGEAVASINATIDTLGSVYKVMGQERVQKSEALLAEMSKINKKKAQLKLLGDANNYSNALINDFIKSAKEAGDTYVKPQILKKVQGGLVKAHARLLNAGVSKIKIFTKESQKVDGYTEEQVNDLKKMLDEFGIDALVPIDGNDIIKSGDIVFANQDLVKFSDKSAILKGITYDTVPQIVGRNLTSEGSKLLNEAYTEVTGLEVTESNVNDPLVSLLFDKDFYSYVLLKNAESGAPVEAINMLVQVDQLLGKELADISNTSPKITNKAVHKLLGKVRKNMQNGIITYATQYQTLDLSLVNNSILSTDLKSAISDYVRNHKNVQFTDTVNQVKQDPKKVTKKDMIDQLTGIIAHEMAVDGISEEHAEMLTKLGTNIKKMKAADLKAKYPQLLEILNVDPSYSLFAMKEDKSSTILVRNVERQLKVLEAALGGKFITKEFHDKLITKLKSNNYNDRVDAAAVLTLISRQTQKSENTVIYLSRNHVDFTNEKITSGVEEIFGVSWDALITNTYNVDDLSANALDFITNNGYDMNDNVSRLSAIRTVVNNIDQNYTLTPNGVIVKIMKPKDIFLDKYADNINSLLTEIENSEKGVVVSDVTKVNSETNLGQITIEYHNGSDRWITSKNTTNGYFDQKRGKIVLRRGLKAEKAIKTLMHEMTHAAQFDMKSEIQRFGIGDSLGGNLNMMQEYRDPSRKISLARYVSDNFPMLNAFIQNNLKKSSANSSKWILAYRLVDGELKANATDSSVFSEIGFTFQDGYNKIISPDGKMSWVLKDSSTTPPSNLSISLDVDSDIDGKSSRYVSNEDADNSMLSHFKRKGQRIMMDPKLQDFVISADPKQLDERLLKLIQRGDIKKFNMYAIKRFVAQAKEMNDYTFSLIAEKIYGNEEMAKFSFTQAKEMVANFENLASSAYFWQISGNDDKLNMKLEPKEMAKSMPEIEAYINRMGNQRGELETQLVQAYTKATNIAIRGETGVSLSPVSVSDINLMPMLMSHYKGTLSSVLTVTALTKSISWNRENSTLSYNTITDSVTSTENNGKGGVFGNNNWFNDLADTDDTFGNMEMSTELQQALDDIDPSEKILTVKEFIITNELNRINQSKGNVDSLNTDEKFRLLGIVLERVNSIHENLYESSPTTLNTAYMLVLSGETITLEQHLIEGKDSTLNKTGVTKNRKLKDFEKNAALNIREVVVDYLNSQFKKEVKNLKDGIDVLKDSNAGKKKALSNVNARISEMKTRLSRDVGVISNLNDYDTLSHYDAIIDTYQLDEKTTKRVMYYANLVKNPVRVKGDATAVTTKSLQDAATRARNIEENSKNRNVKKEHKLGDVNTIPIEKLIKFTQVEFSQLSKEELGIVMKRFDSEKPEISKSNTKTSKSNNSDKSDKSDKKVKIDTGKPTGALSTLSGMISAKLQIPGLSKKTVSDLHKLRDNLRKMSQAELYKQYDTVVELIGKVKEPNVEKSKGKEKTEVKETEVKETKTKKAMLDELKSMISSKLSITGLDEKTVSDLNNLKTNINKMSAATIRERYDTIVGFLNTIEETKVEKTEVKETKVEDKPKVEEPKVEETKVEETKVEETKVEETKVEEKPKTKKAMLDELKSIISSKLSITGLDEKTVADLKNLKTNINKMSADAMRERYDTILGFLNTIEKTPNVEKTEVKETKVEEKPKVEETKVEETKVEETKVEETNVEEKPKVKDKPKVADSGLKAIDGNGKYTIKYNGKFVEISYGVRSSIEDSLHEIEANIVNLLPDNELDTFSDEIMKLVSFITDSSNADFYEQYESIVAAFNRLSDKLNELNPNNDTEYRIEVGKALSRFKYRPISASDINGYLKVNQDATAKNLIDNITHRITSLIARIQKSDGITFPKTYTRALLQDMPDNVKNLIDYDTMKMVKAPFGGLTRKQLVKLMLEVMNASFVVRQKSFIYAQVAKQHRKTKDLNKVMNSFVKITTGNLEKLWSELELVKANLAETQKTQEKHGKEIEELKQAVRVNQMGQSDKLYQDNTNTVTRTLSNKRNSVNVTGQKFSFDSRFEPNAIAEQLLQNSWSKTRMSNVQGVTKNKEQTIVNSKEFYTNNADVFHSMTPADAENVAMWFMDANMTNVAAGSVDMKKFEAVRIYTLSFLLSEMYKKESMYFTIDSNIKHQIEEFLTQKMTQAGTSLAVWKNLLEAIDPLSAILSVDMEMNGVILTQQEKHHIIESAISGDVEYINKVQKDIISRVSEESTSSHNMLRKISVVRSMAMLSSPITWLRNILSNKMLRKMNKWSEKIGGVIAPSKTISSQFKMDKPVTNNITDFIKRSFIDNKLFDTLLSNVSRFNPSSITKDNTNKLDKNSVFINLVIKSMYNQFYNENLFKNKTLTWLHSKLMHALSDNNYVREASIRYYGKILAERGYEIDQDTELNDGMMNDFAVAVGMGMADYMHSDNIFNKIETILAEESETALFAYKLVLPFASAGWNWFKAALTYSPAGLGRSIVRLARLESEIIKAETDWAKGKSQVSPELTEYLIRRDLGAGVIGTVSLMFGMLLKAFGIIDLDDDDYGNPKLIIGKLEIDISTIFGSSSVLAGAALLDGLQEGGFKQGLDSMLDPVMDGFFLTQVLELDKYNTGGLGTFGLSYAEQTILSFIPNMSRWLASSGSFKPNNTFQKAVSRIPFLGSAFNVPKRVNVHTGKTDSAMDVFNRLMPFIDIRTTSVQEANTVALGINKKELKGSYTVDGVKYQLSAQDTATLNKMYGEWNADALTMLYSDKLKVKVKVDNRIVSLKYSQMTTAQQARAVSSIYAKNSKYARIASWLSQGHKYYATATEYNFLRQLGITKGLYVGDKGYVASKKVR